MKLQIQGPESQQLWHDIDPFLFKHRPNFADHHHQLWRLHISEIIPRGTKNEIPSTKHSTITPPPETRTQFWNIRSTYPAMMSTVTANPMARGARLLFSSSTAVRSTVNTSRNVRMPSARIAQPGYTPGPRVWAPPWIPLYTDSGKTAFKKSNYI